LPIDRSSSSRGEPAIGSSKGKCFSTTIHPSMYGGCISRRRRSRGVILLVFNPLVIDRCCLSPNRTYSYATRGIISSIAAMCSDSLSPPPFTFYLQIFELVGQTSYLSYLIGTFFSNTCSHPHATVVSFREDGPVRQVCWHCSHSPILSLILHTISQNIERIYIS
jgi:hypothetical protein